MLPTSSTEIAGGRSCRRGYATRRIHGRKGWRVDSLGFSRRFASYRAVHGWRNSGGEAAPGRSGRDDGFANSLRCLETHTSSVFSSCKPIRCTPIHAARTATSNARPAPDGAAHPRDKTRDLYDRRGCATTDDLPGAALSRVDRLSPRRERTRFRASPITTATSSARHASKEKRTTRTRFYDRRPAFALIVGARNRGMYGRADGSDDAVVSHRRSLPGRSSTWSGACGRGPGRLRGRDARSPGSYARRPGCCQNQRRTR